MILDIEPMPKPRMTRADAWKKRKCVMDYWDWKRRLLMLVNPSSIDFNAVYFIFHVKMPDSWPEKKKVLYEGKPHQQRPDADNYHKGITDALLDEDSHLWRYAGEKLWARKPSIQLLTLSDAIKSRYANIANNN